MNVLVEKPRTHLEPHECRVLRLLIRGLSNKQIGGWLELSEGCVKQYVHNACKVLGFHSRQEVIAWWYEAGLKRP